MERIVVKNFDSISDKEMKLINSAIKNNTPIIISGKQGPLGKTRLENLIRSKGGVAHEEWECLRVEFTGVKEKGMEELFRRFEVKDEKNLDKFKDLVNEKNLSREDLILVLETVSLKEVINEETI